VKFLHRLPEEVDADMAAVHRAMLAWTIIQERAEASH